MGSVQIMALAGKELPLAARMRVKKLLHALPELLEHGERVLHLGTSSGSALVAATDRRLLVVTGNDRDADEIPYHRILSFKTSKRGRKPSLDIRAESGDLAIDGVGDGYHELCRLVHTRMWEASLERAVEPGVVQPLPRAASA